MNNSYIPIQTRVLIDLNKNLKSIKENYENNIKKTKMVEKKNILIKKYLEKQIHDYSYELNLYKHYILNVRNSINEIKRN